MTLAWGAPPPSAAPFELVLGTDLFYAREAMGLLVSSRVSSPYYHYDDLLPLRSTYD